MLINFKSIEIEGFQSIGKAHVELNEQGTVLIKGINNYDSMASSNGSGKSSIPESILYALYGKTSSGVSNPKNRYYPDGLCVKLIFAIDNTEYTVLRSVDHKVHKTSVRIYRGTEDISGRNATDTNKIIKDDIIPFDQDIFLSTIFLSQGFAGKLSSLTPAGRKERLESLTDTASQIDEFRDKVSDIKSKYSDNVNELNADRSKKIGQKESIESQIESIETKISNIKATQKTYDVEGIEARIDDLQYKLTKINSDIDKLSEEEDKLSEPYKILSDKLSSNKSRYYDRVSHLKIMKENSGDTVCPTCGQVIKRDTIPDELIKEKEDEIEALSSMIERLNSAIKDNRDASQKMREDIKDKQYEGSKIMSDIRSLEQELVEASKTIDTSEYESMVIGMKASIPDLCKEIDQASEDISKNETLRDVANHCVSLISKAFRGYMLQEIVDFMNSRLEIYSRLVFSNESDTIRLLVDSTKLDIYLGDVLYDTLSGGERKKVDISLVLAQRDLSLNISGMSCNLLILDEILENCDATASDAVLNLLSSVAEDIDSMFIISHNDYAIQTDAILTVTKGVNRVASISIN